MYQILIFLSYTPILPVSFPSLANDTLFPLIQVWNLRDISVSLSSDSHKQLSCLFHSVFLFSLDHSFHSSPHYFLMDTMSCDLAFFQQTMILFKSNIIGCHDMLLFLTCTCFHLLLSAIECTLPIYTYQIIDIFSYPLDFVLFPLSFNKI